MSSSAKRSDKVTRDFHKWSHVGVSPLRSELSEDVRMANLRAKRVMQHKHRLYDRQERLSVNYLRKERLHVEEEFEEEGGIKIRISANEDRENEDDLTMSSNSGSVMSEKMSSRENSFNSHEDIENNRDNNMLRKNPQHRTICFARGSAPASATRHRQRRHSDGSLFDDSAQDVPAISTLRNRVRTAPPQRTTERGNQLIQQFILAKRPKSAFDRLTEHYMKRGPSVKDVRSRLREEFSIPVDERWPDITREMEKRRKTLSNRNARDGKPSDSSSQSDVLVRETKSRQEIEAEIHDLKNFDKEFAKQMARIRLGDTRRDGTARLLGSPRVVQEEEVVTQSASKWRCEEQRRHLLAENRHEQEQHNARMKLFLSHLEETGYIPRKRRYDIIPENHYYDRRIVGMFVE